MDDKYKKIVKNFNLNELPSDVLEAMFTVGPVSEETAVRIHKTIEQNPQYFSWKHAWSKISPKTYAEYEKDALKVMEKHKSPEDNFGYFKPHVRNRGLLANINAKYPEDYEDWYVEQQDAWNKMNLIEMFEKVSKKLADKDAREAALTKDLKVLWKIHFGSLPFKKDYAKCYPEIKIKIVRDEDKD
jgi:hypothetical protein